MNRNYNNLKDYDEMGREPKVGDEVYSLNLRRKAVITRVAFDPAPEDAGAIKDSYYCEFSWGAGEFDEDGDSSYWLCPLDQ